ncbi:ATP-binding cassette domain-containing protein [Solibacillus sp. MA9]|uniref:ATP-binding cassette domain-containing protein n=1 Tax=Solibacillus palustris TaxID=2908203 RepID=A0ABS9UB34_9BACL|nr:ATP-binding cassette domain-containing protein [Solibacillus sp. MA9]MCH7321330.1 ATP-binding cassette domain-containing protein [Solibacillus sp. MA9]
MKSAVIEVENVQRTYQIKSGFWKKSTNQVEAVKGISFEVNKGEIFGLLGPNGAGKTTTIKMLTTMLIPSAGTIKIFGLDPVSEYKALRPRINFILGGERNLYWRLSAYDNLAYFADLYKIPRAVQQNKIPELLRLVELEEAAHRKVETFSKGMKQRLQIARGLLNNPEILFLDEPSIGLDPISARKLRDLIKNLNAQGTTIVLTTHYMFEADELCDRIAFINNGEIIAIDTPKNLKQHTNQQSIVECTIVGSPEQELRDSLAEKQINVMEMQPLQNGVKVRIATEQPQQIVMVLYSSAQFHVVDLAITKPTLEDAYIAMIGGN